MVHEFKVFRFIIAICVGVTWKFLLNVPLSEHELSAFPMVFHTVSSFSRMQTSKKSRRTKRSYEAKQSGFEKLCPLVEIHKGKKALSLKDLILTR